tara:strand:- start:1141 stop:1248 length:108 start_codon:yes stop_codon:yes gene_type:complete
LRAGLIKYELLYLLDDWLPALKGPSHRQQDAEVIQ